MKMSDNWDLVERKMLELRILTNANWKNQEYELAVMGEKMLRSVESARMQAESARMVLDMLPESINDLKDENKLQNIFDAQTLESLKF
ncbi:MAG TPA: hypothetical protein VLH15_05840 [Dehalococcoidales bacterium]|nr:hypothetical protein [Dehalococcoidales bacterium]